ncbi:MAG: RecX family transcriptional regulator [Gammaproteobacteria bacterium HGW-Gammaproteobacteria-3]|nr:MAG: RecX family transcriptional regulator [Gammaproteobacteria bacterium HGW-Gammaproteobacteria-3]
MDDALKAIRETGLRLLARREHSRLELFNKLTARGFEPRSIDTVLEQWLEQGWLSDRRFAESYARYRIAKGYGPNRIAYELRQAGIENFDLDAFVHESAVSWLAIAHQVYEKKYSQTPILTRQEWARRRRFLLQRGFVGTLINALSDQLNLKFA